MNLIGIKDAFLASNKMTNYGIPGYHVQNKYFDKKKETYAPKKSNKKLVTKKGSYLDDYIAIHSQIPGPGVYDFTIKGQILEKSTVKRKSYFSEKKTIFDEMCELEKRQKRPGPGQYQPKTKKRPSSAVHSKPVKMADRINYLDQVQYQASISPGVGAYNPRPQSAKIQRKERMKPDDWIKKHAQKPKTNQKNPSPITYNPISVERKDFSRRRKTDNTWGNVDRFKTTGDKDKLGPGKYIAHELWGTKAGFGSLTNTAGVYYR